MKWLSTSAAALTWAAAAATAAPDTYLLDPQASFVHFEVLHFGTSTIRGRIGPIAGSVLLDRTAGRGEVGLRIDMRSVDTGFAIFDARLKQADLLATQEFPEAYFVATRFTFSGDQVAEVRGEFTLRGIGQPLSLKAERFACRTEGAGAAAVQVCGGDFEGEVRRSDFGATFGLPFVADRVRLLVRVEGRLR